MRTLCLGEALVDLVCERPAADVGEAGAFVPRPGGTAANVCVTAARHGGAVALAGGAGDDPWGRWLRDRLRAEGVQLDWFALVEDAPTAVAFVLVDAAGEPGYLVYGAGAHAALEAATERLSEAVEACDALVLTSNTLVEEGERAATLAARERALELGRPVIFDANLRLHRWPHPGRAATVARECIPGAFLVKCNRDEAERLSGESDPDRAAAGLLAGGARNVVVTLGAGGAILRGELRADVPGAPAGVVDASGAGDALLGVLVARLGQSRFYPPTLAAALPDAVREAARTTERWGAV
ncbi:MAG TPA: PfkB family carbohydrate kinase [Solirubrobacteraceae bacterium]